MAAPKTLSQFRAAQNDEGATLSLEAEDGSVVEFDATFEQLELMADELDDILSANDDATEVKDDASCNRSARAPRRAPRRTSTEP